MVSCCEVAVSGAWDVVALFSACLCVMVVGSAKCAVDSFPALQSHMALFSTFVACGSVPCI